MPSSDTSSSFGSAPNTSSSYSTDVVRARPVQGASAFRTAEPIEDDTAGSAITLKGAPTVIRPAPPPPADDICPAGVKLPTRHEIEKDRAEKSRLANMDRTKEKKDEIPPESQIGTIPSLTSSGIIGKSPEKGDSASSGGTHRFTLVDKDAVPLINGKKVSACEFYPLFCCGGGAHAESLPTLHLRS